MSRPPNALSPAGNTAALAVHRRPGGPPGWPQTGGAPDDLSPVQRRWLGGTILLAHGAALWGLLQVSAVNQAVQQATPMLFSLIHPTPPVPVPPRPQAALPPPPRPVLAKPPPPAAVLTAAPSPAPVAFTVPDAPPPQAAPPAPRAPPEASAVLAAPQAAAAPPAPPTTPAAPPAPPAPQLIPASAVQYLEPPVVSYPRLSRRNGESGRVLLRAYIARQGGAPRSVQISRSSGHARLDEAALAAVQQARFKPYSENGQAQEGWALIPIDFELEK